MYWNVAGEDGWDEWKPLNGTNEPYSMCCIRLRQKIMFSEWKHQLKWNAKRALSIIYTLQCMETLAMAVVVVGEADENGRFYYCCCCWGFSNFLFLFRSLGLDFILALSYNEPGIAAHILAQDMNSVCVCVQYTQYEQLSYWIYV